MAEGDKRPFIKLYWDIWDDKRLTGNERLVLISLLRHYNAEKRRAWPSLDTIASEIGYSRILVWRNLKTLEAKGFVKTEKQSGKVTLYELPIANEPVSDRNDTHFNLKRVEEEPISDFNTTHFKTKQVPISNRNTTHFKSKHELDKRTRSIRTRSIELEKQSRAREADFEAEFEEFWKAYPKPKNPDKTPTRKRYEALRKKGVSGDDLLKAAQGYARSMQGTDPRYIKHGATFLGPQEPWRDYLTEPEPVSDEPPDAEKLFPDLAEWMRQKRSEANER